MTKTRYGWKQLVSLVIAFLALQSCLPVTAAAENSPMLSKQELKTLRATAKTPADQEKLAAYYRDRAQQLTQKAAEFTKWADFYATQPATIESKQGISCGQCTSHYRYFSRLYQREAKDSEALAAHYEQLAQRPEGK
jgi:hypothetical protein